MRLITKNQHKLWAILGSVLFHLLLLLFLLLESKQMNQSEDFTPEMIMQLDNLEKMLDEQMPVVADNNGEKDVATNLKPEPPKEQEIPPLPPEHLIATEKIDTVPTSHATELLEAMIPPPAPEPEDSVMADLKEIVKQNNTDQAQRAAQFALDQDFIRKNYKTIYNLRKVFAFAKKAREMKDRLDKQLLTIHDSGERRKAIKAMEKEVWASFESAARQMSTSQGKLLLKLLARETGQTGYAIVKEYKGAIPAVFWQGVAVMFRQNLKSTYDSLGEDALLEQIVRKYEKKEIK